MSLPCQSELTHSNTSIEIFVKRRTEVDKLDFIRIAKQSFGRLIESFGDMIQGVRGAVLRVLEFY